MNDLAIDPIANDIALSGLDMFVIKGADRVRQQLVIKLNLWTETWFLDTEFGTPYLEKILGKRISLNGAIAALKQSILEVADVDAITEFNYNFSRQTRKLEVDFVAGTPYGLIRVKT